MMWRLKMTKPNDVVLWELEKRIAMHDKLLSNPYNASYLCRWCQNDSLDPHKGDCSWVQFYGRTSLIYGQGEEKKK